MYEVHVFILNKERTRKERKITKQMKMAGFVLFIKISLLWRVTQVTVLNSKTPFQFGEQNKSTLLVYTNEPRICTGRL